MATVKKALLIVIYTALVYAATVVLQVYQPATGGYFNLGESMIYLAALTSGPLVAAVAGGVGASLADLTTGYAIFAPATLVIKFAEGLAAGLLVAAFRRIKSRPAAVASVGALYAVGAFYGVSYWAGLLEVGPSQWLGLQFPPGHLYLPWYAWAATVALLGAVAFYGVSRYVLKSLEPIALLTAGALMVAGYFLYEYFVSNPLTGRPPIDALYEVPVNIGQALAGVMISVPIAVWLERAGYLEAAASK